MQAEIALEPADAAVQVRRDVQPWTSLTLVPLLALLIGVLGWATGKRMSVLTTAASVEGSYRPADEAFFQEVEAFYARNAVTPGVVRVPPGQVAYLLAQQWAFLPELRLKAGTPYTLWATSTDSVHSFTLRDQNLNFVLVPGYAYSVELMFEEPGQYAVSCTEYCGLGHAGMFGRIIVEP